MLQLETKRLIIRPTVKEDNRRIHEMLSDEETMKFFVEGTYSEEKVSEFVNRNQKETHHFTIFLKSSNRIVGKISYNPWFMKDTKEIGWIFFRTASGNGYCTEASKAIIEYAFEVEKIHRLIATCQPENKASIRVCEKLGMRLEGHFKDCIYYKDDIWWDELFYSMLKEDYDKQKGEI
ncbi:Putative ribosomal N-acetyltransferase YdaF [Candidatus Izimaplasma bacterium HR1]|jgi:RimJ/RimL family protein N-acetyltransferase|uniref:GNAT family N-acetyltransferase n=1 Tax=Candidatus Izimoplasma sp. HR1 TaxID=1541959 RepID=UPI0004F58BEA|nr:Putative ribosomal N-acetyltransferase YdaF [Candidatus Izimaplasma bacterium HR1]